MLRFLYGWSLKPFVYVLYAIGGSISIWAYFDPNLVHLTGLAWDCGAVTTGPVTVPLVLALGIGISRVASSGGGAAGGFGVVTLASAFPILAVLGLGIYFLPSVPNPSSDVEFCSTSQRARAVSLFDSEDAFKGYVMRNGSPMAREAFFKGDTAALDAYVVSLSKNVVKQEAIFGSAAAFESWLFDRGSNAQRLAIYGSEEAVRARAEALYSNRGGSALDVTDLLKRNSLGAVQAIVPLSLIHI